MSAKRASSQAGSWVGSLEGNACAAVASASLGHCRCLGALPCCPEIVKLASAVSWARISASADCGSHGLSASAGVAGAEDPPTRSCRCPSCPNAAMRSARPSMPCSMRLSACACCSGSPSRTWPTSRPNWASRSCMSATASRRREASSGVLLCSEADMAIPWRPETAWQCLPARASRVRRSPLGESKQSEFGFVRAGGSVRGLGDAAPESSTPKVAIRRKVSVKSAIAAICARILACRRRRFRRADSRGRGCHRNGRRSAHDAHVQGRGD